MANIHKNIEQAVNDLLRNGIVAIPTETVYGLAGNAYSEIPIQKIFKAKDRPAFDPLIVHVPKSWLHLSELSKRGIVAAELLNAEMFLLISELMKRFMPGPLTLLLPRGPRIPLIVTSGRALVGIRSPKHDLAQKLLEQAALPLAAPSANRFGRTSPTDAQHVQAELGSRITSILDGGSCDVGLESTVAVVNPDLSITILRPGLIGEADFLKLSLKVSRSGEAQRVSSPGTLDQHYAPEKDLIAISSGTELLQKFQEHPDAILLIPDLSIEEKPDWSDALKKIPETKRIFLNRTSDMISGSEFDVARNLFAALHRYNLDPKQKIAFVSPVLKHDGIWIAIQDRLNRASKK